MKRILTLLLVSTIATRAQELPATLEYGSGTVAPSTATLFKFDDVPVSLYTGVPDVSIKLFSLPTRSKDINISATYNYHPGLSGWNLIYGGSISRVIENSQFKFQSNEIGFANNTLYTSDVYKFSFMGHSGSFVLKKSANNVLVPSLLTNDADVIKIDIDYNQSTYFVNSFSAYDTKGYRFVFDVYDKFIAADPGMPTITRETRTTYRLTAIYDNNGKKLAGITYTEKFNQEQGSNTKEYTNQTNLITSEGFGKTQFVYRTLDWGARLDEITVTDMNGNAVKRIDFREYDKLIFRDAAKNKNEEYSFFYSDGIYGNYDAERGLHRIDKFGYPNFIPFRLYENSYMDEGAYISNSVNPNIITRGVLEKIGLPTGGSILYEYESNTYSYFQGTSISEVLRGNTFQEDPDFYYNYWDYETTFAYNHIVEEIKRGNMGMVSFFDINGTGQQTIHISVRPKLYYSNLSLSWVYPLVNIYGPGSSFPHYRPYNLENYGYGRGFVLNSGRHTIQVGNFTEQGDGAEYIISKIRRNPDVKKWKYGGGRRIKRIAYFDTDTPADLFRKGPNYYPQEYKPVKETNYSYNLFDEPNRSSGNLVADSYEGFSDKYSQLEFVGYKNVTVTDSGNNGKTQYTFTSPMDFVSDPSESVGNSYSRDYKRGLLKNKKIYDNNNVLLQETNYDFIFYDENYYSSYYTDRTVKDRTGKARVQVEKNIFYPSVSSAPIIQSTIFDYNNDTNRSLASKTMTGSDGENTKTMYFYHQGNSPFSKNRIAEIERTETYKGSNLISTNKTVYGNTWSGNASWMPISVQSSKENNPLETRINFISYDEYSHPTELQQENGMKTCLIWGYNKTQLIAKIENVNLASIPQNLILAAQSATDAIPYVEANAITALTNLRRDPSLSNAFVTTYTYKQLIGISTVTEPNGSSMRYEYDTFGRMKGVYDDQGNLVSENAYRYKTQN